jgi:hypothetical protein
LRRWWATRGMSTASGGSAAQVRRCLPSCRRGGGRPADGRDPRWPPPPQSPRATAPAKASWCRGPRTARSRSGPGTRGTAQRPGRWWPAWRWAEAAARPPLLPPPAPLGQAGGCLAADARTSPAPHPPPPPATDATGAHRARHGHSPAGAARWRPARSLHRRRRRHAHLAVAAPRQQRSSSRSGGRSGSWRPPCATTRRGPARQPALAAAAVHPRGRQDPALRGNGHPAARPLLVGRRSALLQALQAHSGRPALRCVLRLRQPNPHATPPPPPHPELEPGWCSSWAAGGAGPHAPCRTPLAAQPAAAAAATAAA